MTGPSSLESRTLVQIPEALKSKLWKSSSVVSEGFCTKLDLISRMVEFIVVQFTKFISAASRQTEA